MTDNNSFFNVKGVLVSKGDEIEIETLTHRKAIGVLLDVKPGWVSIYDERLEMRRIFDETIIWRVRRIH
jgi:hypothetical protein